MELIEKLKEIKKNIRTWDYETSRCDELWRFEEGSHISVFYRTNILSKAFIPIVAMIVVKRFGIVTHCCAANVVVKLTTFSTA